MHCVCVSLPCSTAAAAVGSFAAVQLSCRDCRRRDCCSAKASTMLYPHQVEGVRWLWSLFRLDRGGILADDMGLGGWGGVGCIVGSVHLQKLNGLLKSVKPV